MSRLRRFFQRALLFYLRRFPLATGKGALSTLASISADSGEADYINADGIRFALRLGEYQMRQIFLFDYYEKNSVHALKAFLKPGMTFVDVGANIGQYSLLAGKFIGPSGTVIAFEPDERLHPILKQNIFQNQLTNVRLESLALSNTAGKATLRHSANTGNLGAASLWHEDPSLHSAAISTTSLDAYVRQNHLDVDIMKIDVEGSEMQVLLGATETLKKNRPMVIICEMNSDMLARAGTSTAQIMAFLKNMGFSAYTARAWPRGLTEISQPPPPEWIDNVFFLRGFSPAK